MASAYPMRRSELPNPSQNENHPYPPHRPAAGAVRGVCRPLEGVISPLELDKFIHLGILDGMTMKPARCGSLTSNKRQIELCRKHGLFWVGSALCDPDLSLAAALALDDAYGLDTVVVLNGSQFLAAPVLKTPSASPTASPKCRPVPAWASR